MPLGAREARRFIVAALCAEASLREGKHTCGGLISTAACSGHFRADKPKRRICDRRHFRRGALLPKSTMHLKTAAPSSAGHIPGGGM